MKTEKIRKKDEASEFAESIINTVREPLIALDQDLRVVKVSRSFYDCFKVNPEETVGQLIYDLGNKQWDIPKLRELLETILLQKTTFDNYEVEHEFSTIGRRTMLLNARQIQRGMGKERIILLAIEDITERKEIEAGLEKTRKELAVIKKIADEALEYADSTINTIREPLIVLDQDLRVITASRSFYEFFKVNPEETVGQLIYDLGNKQWDIPKLRELLETILPQKATFNDYEVEHEFSTIGRCTMLLNARQIQRASGKERIILLAIEDITERKRLEDLLAEAEKRYRRVFETASDGIVLLEKREGHITHVNPATEKMLGYSKEECIGKKLQDIGVPLDMSDFPAIIQALNKRGIINHDDVQVKTKSGQYLYTDIYLVDKAKLAQCNIRDITERKKTQDALKQSENEFRLLAEAMPQIVWVTRPDGWNTYFNQQWVDYTGQTLEESCGHGWNKPFHPDDQKRAWDAWQKAINYGTAYSLECRLRRADGVYKWWLIRGVPVLDEHGAVVKWFGTCTDIDEAATHLQEVSRLNQQIIESVQEGIIVYGPDLKYQVWNTFMEGLTELSASEVLGRHPLEVFPFLRETDIMANIEKALAGEVNEAKRFQFHIPSTGQSGWASDVSAPLKNVTGKIIGVIATVRDITEHLMLEDQLRHAQKMEAVGTLAGGIAHDFNNILNVIMGFGTMVMDRIGDDPLSKEQMNEVLTAADRAATLTKRLLIFSRKQVVEVQPVNINELILGLQKMLLRIISESIEIALDLADRPLIVMADAGQIEQVLMNLVSNARDAMPEGGRLTIGTGLQEIDDEYITVYGYGKPGTYALITVADTGQGMDEDTKKNIFEPFFTTKGIGEGTGLGLAISYEIIKQHSGYIKAYSEEGRGTTFKIWFPLIEDTTEEKPKAEALSYPKGGTETILVAEDDASLRKLSRIVLESSGYNVITAEDGEDAITKFMENRERISLVLVDMIMPKKNGKEVGETIRKVSPRTNILFASGYTMDIIKTRELTESGFDFLLKPVVPRDLLRKVREILDK